MSKEPIEDFGKQVKYSLKKAFKNGDFSKLQDIGPAAEKMVKDISGNIENSLSFSSSEKDKNTGRQPYEPTVMPKGQQAPPAWAGKAWTGFGGDAGWPRRKRKNPFGVLPIVLGGVGIGIFSVLFIVSGVLYLVGAAVSGLSMLGISALGMVAGGVSLKAGTGRRALGNRLNSYYALLEQKRVQTFEELALGASLPVEQVKKDVQKALRKQLMPGVRTDAAGDTLMLGDEAYRLYLDSESSRLQREKEETERIRRMQDPKTADLERFKLEGERSLREIRDANKAIDDAEMSEKMDRLEVTAGKIFAYVQQHPEKLPDTRKMMEYYLPTTLKLLREYRKYEETDVQVASVLKAKREIADTLETVDKAFNRLLESLYRDDTLDVKTDIKVLQAMLRQEGLAGEEFKIDAEDNQDTILRF